MAMDYWVSSVKNFKPMLYSNDEVSLDLISYPITATIKYDGVRVIFKDGEMYNRSLKVVPNEKIHKYFKKLKQLSKEKKVIIEGEFLVPGLALNELVGFITSKSREVPRDAYIMLFDSLDNSVKLDCETKFWARHNWLVNNIPSIDVSKARVTKLYVMSTRGLLEAFFEHALEHGEEGLVLRNPDGKYKFGRLTVREGIGYKMKAFKTFDAQVIGYEQQFQNTNEKLINELGNSYRSNTKDAKIPKGILATLTVRLEDGTEQEVTMTGDLEYRKSLWDTRDHLPGSWIEFRGIDYEKKDKIKYPTFIRFRDDR